MNIPSQLLPSEPNARDALFALDAACERTAWVRILMGAKAAGLSLDDVTNWSSTGSNYQGPLDVARTWNSIASASGIGEGTLYFLAREAGWRPPLKARPDVVARIAQAAAKHPAVMRSERRAADLWSTFPSAPPDHPYIVAKRGSVDGVRLVPDTCELVVAGQSIAGCLAVPVASLGSRTPESIQFIPAPGGGKKLNLPGGSMRGVFVAGTIADLPGPTCVYVVEGIGQAWACLQATNFASVVTFGSSRDKVITVLADIRSRYPSVSPVVVADSGKEKWAAEIAASSGAVYVCMPAGWPQNSDVNDLARRDGVGALAALLASTLAPPQRYKLLTAEDLLQLPHPLWRVRGVIPNEGIAAVFGPSGSGKSFLVFDLALAIAEGRPWFGHRVRQGTVVYVALEGQVGFQLRAQAWMKHHGRPLPSGIRFVFQAFDLANSADVSDLAQAVNHAGGGAVVILDTLNAASPSVDENASGGMGIVLQAAKQLQAICAALILFVHHSGKDAARGLRGHSSLVAALDASIEVTRESDARQWRIAKSKDGADDAFGQFALTPVELEPDEDGEPVSSCVVMPASGPANSGFKASRLQRGGANQRVAIGVLQALLQKSHSRGMASSPPDSPCIELKAAIEAVGPRLPCDPGRRTERAGQAIAGLVANGTLAHDTGWIWMP